MSNKRAGRALADVMGELEESVTPDHHLPTTTPGPGLGLINSAPAIVPINVMVTPGDRKRLRQLSLDADLSLQKLGHEAWNRLLEARGLEPLTPVAANVPSGRARRS